MNDTENAALPARPVARRPRPDLLTADFQPGDLAGFDLIIDVRSPGEYSEDHLPGAINLPVLDDAERAEVGTLHKQVSPFAARRRGAALVARHIAEHVERHFSDKDKDWRPLVYCWRGGSRSGSMVHILRAIGWPALQLEGGYKSYRALVRRELDELPRRFRFNVVCGRTGSGKSRLLDALARAGAQVLDLEALAAHRGSVLGDLPDAPQPSQKSFESTLWSILGTLDPHRPVWVEAESKRVGLLRVPDALMDCMRQGECFVIETLREERIKLLLDDYRHLVANPALMVEKIHCLKGLHPDAQLSAWQAQTESGRWVDLVDSLLQHHYDPAYGKSMYRNYKRIAQAQVIAVSDASPAGLDRVAKALVAGRSEVDPAGQKGAGNN